MRLAAALLAVSVLAPLSLGAQDTAPMQAFRKFDFVPGEKVIAAEDFSEDAIGDFPARWNTNASAEIVTLEGQEGRWLMLTKGGFFTPDLPGPLPESFTLEFDLLAGSKFQGRNIAVTIAALDEPAKPAVWQTAGHRFRLDLDANDGSGAGYSTTEARQNGDVVSTARTTTAQFHFEKKNPVHVSIWRQKQRVRVYLNEEKVWDVPKALTEGATYNAIIFYQHDVAPEYQYYIGPLRLAVGAPDTRNKLLTAGKWVTNGIRFDSASATIRGESYGTLKEIADVLKENAALKVKIVGHTDSDGDDAANLDLSKRRAAAVKAMLATEFGIEEARMEPDGQGESQPADKNDTSAGKANNRRVEFLKV